MPNSSVFSCTITSSAQIFILDADRKPVPVGTIGELFVGGSGVAEGNRENAGSRSRLGQGTGVGEGTQSTRPVERERALHVHCAAHEVVQRGAGVGVENPIAPDDGAGVVDRTVLECFVRSASYSQ